MSVERLRLERVRAVVTPPFSTSRGEITERLGLVLTLHVESGARAEGEATPLPGFSVDDIDQAERALTQFSGCPLPAGAERVRAAVAEVASPSARFALETALLGLAAQASSTSPTALLCGSDRASPEVCQLLDRVGASVPAGARSVKLKVGRAGRFDEEIAWARSLRAAHPGLSMRFDANGAFSPVDLPSRLDALAEVQPEFVEDPSTVPAMLALRDSPVPIALDHGLRRLASGTASDLTAGAGEIRALLERAFVTTLVIKPTVLGGALAAMDLARGWPEKGVVISHALEGRVALRAHHAIAAAIGTTDSGLGPHRALDAFEVAR